MTGTPADRAAREILAQFDAYRGVFRQITRSAAKQFHQRDWHGLQQASGRRLSAYGEHVTAAHRAIASAAPLSWPDTKHAYIEAIRTYPDFELAETFFNSVYRSVTDDAPVSNAHMFVDSAFEQPPLRMQRPVYRIYRPDQGVVSMMTRILKDLPLSLPWRDLDRDVRNILRSLPEERPEIVSSHGLSIQVLRSVFFRNKGAYAVGKIVYQQQQWPVALPLLQTDEGELYVDTLICDEDELSIMFSFTRAYFLVDTPQPRALVDYLQELLPNKKRSEIYATIGLHKHGKTEFYRGFLDHLTHSDDRFVIAPGVRGMVMSVFTLPSYQTVFKIIKDRFAPQKQITAAQVREKYYIVKRHDRVGRMADTQEFENFRFPRARFDPELLDELQRVAASRVTLTDDEVLIAHLYTERLMTPLNLHIERAEEASLKSALDEYGNAIKQLAAANIFPGDMLLKNFGVTRHGRVVFYDYDEICYLTEVNFRHIPQPQTPEQEMSAEAWYSVGPNDVFPEEFRRFLFGRRAIKDLFTQMHGELFDPDFWQSLQQDINGGTIHDVFPYRRKKRFDRYGTGP